VPPVFPTAGVPQGAYFVREWGVGLPWGPEPLTPVKDSDPPDPAQSS